MGRKIREPSQPSQSWSHRPIISQPPLSNRWDESTFPVNHTNCVLSSHQTSGVLQTASATWSHISPLGRGPLEEPPSQRETSQSSLHFTALDAPCFFPVLFSFCMRLLVFQDERRLFGSLQRVAQLWKSLVLAVLFALHNFYDQYWGDDQKKSEPREKLKDVGFGLNNNSNARGQAPAAFRDRPSGNSKKRRPVSGAASRKITEGIFFFLLKVRLVSPLPLSLKSEQHLVDRWTATSVYQHHVTSSGPHSR